MDGKWIANIDRASKHSNVIYTSSELASVFDISWGYFITERPDASLVTIGFDVSICSNIWGELKAGLQEKIPHLVCCATFKSKKLVEVFSTLFASSKGIEDFKMVIKKHGKVISYAGSWDMVIIDKSLWGKPWADLVELSDIGLSKPILVSLSLKNE